MLHPQNSVASEDERDSAIHSSESNLLFILRINLLITQTEYQEILKIYLANLTQFYGHVP